MRLENVLKTKRMSPQISGTFQIIYYEESILYNNNYNVEINMLCLNGNSFSAVCRSILNLFLKWHTMSGFCKELSL